MKLLQRRKVPMRSCVRVLEFYMGDFTFWIRPSLSLRPSVIQIAHCFIHILKKNRKKRSSDNGSAKTRRYRSFWLNHRSVARCTCFNSVIEVIVVYLHKTTAFRIFFSYVSDIMMRTTDILCTGDCQCYRLCEGLHIYSTRDLHVGALVWCL